MSLERFLKTLKMTASVLLDLLVHLMDSLM
ncbi:unnamed protein product [Timema podura]|uniref:Uncharacterized protein n=1 Tax=Timema podura TaxID=61482 RepID=A0ABN7P2J6_TIMPD|nr:unnamed protein product [Timema podura]